MTTLRGTIVFRGWPPESDNVLEALLAADIKAAVVRTVLTGDGIAVMVSELVVSDLDLAAARRVVARRPKNPSV